MWLCALCVIGERRVCRRTNRTTCCYLVPEEGSTLGLGSISPKPLIMGRECENKRVKSEFIKLHNNDSLNNQCTVRGGDKFCVHSKLISYGAALPTFFARNFPPPSVGVRQIQAFPNGRELNFVIKNDWRSLRFFFYQTRGLSSWVRSWVYLRNYLTTNLKHDSKTEKMTTTAGHCSN